MKYIIIIGSKNLKFLDKKNLSESTVITNENLNSSSTWFKSKESEIKLSKFCPIAKGENYSPSKTLLGYFNNKTKELIILYINQINCHNLTLRPFNGETIDFFDFCLKNENILVVSKQFKKIKVIHLISKKTLYSFNGYYNMMDKVNKKKLIFCKLLTSNFLILMFDDFKSFRFMDLDHVEYQMMIPYMFNFDFQVDKIEGHPAKESPEPLLYQKKKLHQCFPLIKLSKGYLGQEKQKLLRVIIYIYHLDGCAYKLEYDCLAHKCSVFFWKRWIEVKNLKIDDGRNESHSEDPESWTLV
jgi:hypothetical protein